jgi:DNA-binding CsgD family transcriptional regulator
MDVNDTFDKIVNGLYAGTMDGDAWGRAIDGIVELFGCTGAVLFAANPTTQLVLRDEVYRGDPDLMRTYRQTWAASDIRVARGLEIAVGEPHHERQLLSNELWNRSELLHEFLVPMDIPFILATWLQKSASKVVALTFQGGKSRGAFDAEEIDQLRKLVPHLRRSLEIRDRLEAAQIQVSTLSSLLEQTQLGVIALDRTGLVLQATGLADVVLKEAISMRRERDGTLWIREPAGSQIRPWILGGEPSRNNVSGFWRVARKKGRQDLQVLFAPAPSAGHPSWTMADARWLIFVFDEGARVPAEAMVIAWHLEITLREAEIAVLISMGTSLEAISSQLGITLQTIRTHLKNIFEKTGARSQSDLVRRVLLSPARPFAALTRSFDEKSNKAR